MIKIIRHPGKVSQVFKEGEEREKIAIGGSITETIQARVLYKPRTKTPWSQAGACAQAKNFVNTFSNQKKSFARSAEG